MDIKNEDQVSNINGARRKLLLWTPPVITAVMLPTHAQASVCELAKPIAKASVPSKCAGDPPQGQATITLCSDNAGVPVEVYSITHDAADPNVISGPTSGTLNGDGGIDIVWEGPATDAITCLPETEVTFTVNFTCDGDTNQEDDVPYTFSLLEVLADAVA